MKEEKKEEKEEVEEEDEVEWGGSRLLRWRKMAASNGGMKVYCLNDLKCLLPAATGSRLLHPSRDGVRLYGVRKGRILAATTVVGPGVLQP